jgi:superfamily I DNA/RNA helicase
MSGRDVIALPLGCRRVHVLGGAGSGKTTLARARFTYQGRFV